MRLRRLLIAAGVALASAVGLGQGLSGVTSDPACAALTQLTLRGISVTSAVPVPPGPFMPPNPVAIGPWFTRGVSAVFGADPPVTVPAFCRVKATATPTADSHIAIEIWLPTSSAWNGKLLGTGNAGSGGTIAYPVLAAGLDRGYATANTDLGSGAPTVGDYTFGIGHPELVEDFGHRATHLMTSISRRVVDTYYGRRPRFAYFAGCSTGGRQALVEAHRYPEDYDGIIAGDPDTTVESTFSGAWEYAATHDDPAAYFPATKLPLIAKAVMAECDGLDELVDGVIDDPRRCRFDPAVLQCSGADAPDCFTAPQVAALRKIYSGPHNPRTGALIHAGIEPGTEGGPVGLESILAIPPGAVRPRPVGLSRWTRAWKGPGFDWDADLAAVVRELGPVIGANPDLSAFRRRGGKLLMYSGWADPAEPPRGIVDFFERVRQTSDGTGAAEFARLFMVPGMSHCSGGANVSYFDSLGAMDAWVDRGLLPERIVAARVEGGVVTRTRPICAYPLVARWKGSGSPDGAENFACVAPPPDGP